MKAKTLDTRVTEVAPGPMKGVLGAEGLDQRDHRVDVGNLLGLRPGGIGIDQFVAPLLRLCLHACRLRQAPGIVALDLRESDFVFILLGDLG